MRHFVLTFIEGLWLSGSIWFLYQNNPDMFQRHGSFGVAAFIIIFGVDLYKGLSNSLRIQDLEHQLTDISLLQLSEQNSILIRNMKINSMLWRDYFGKPNLKDDYDDMATHFEALVAQVDNLAESSDKTGASKETIKSEIQKLNQEQVKITKNTNKAQIISLVIATLQWGYGDLLVKFVHG